MAGIRSRSGSERRAAAPREKILEEFQQTLAVVVQPESLYAGMLRALEELFDTSSLALVLLDADCNAFRPAAARGFPQDALAKLSFRPTDNLVNWLKVNQVPLEVEPESGIFRFLSAGEQQTLLELGVRLCVPLVSMGRIIGLLLAGARRSGDYTGQDLSLLAALSSQAALAIENSLLSRQQTERLRKMYRAERLATAGQLASGVAHEIRNPLTAIRSTIQLLVKDAQIDAGRRELLESVVAEVDRINQIITQLLSFARAPELSFAPVALDTVLDFALGLVSAQARMQKVRIVREFAPVPEAPGAEAQLKQVFLNLLMNSLQAMPEGGELRVEIAPVASDSPAHAVRISIADTGCGMTDDVLERIFDPFFTTKPEGTGLGLSVSYAIVEQHGGEVRVRSAPGQGTTVILKLPAGTPARA